MKTFQQIGIGFLTVLSSLPALATKEVGNGGGAWVCRELNGDIRWAKVVDLYEAENDPEMGGLVNKQESESYVAIVDRMKVRLFKALSSMSERTLFNELEKYADRVEYLKNTPPRIIYTNPEDDLTVIDDSLYTVQPGSKRCRNGRLAYEQVVNFQDNGKIKVQSDLFLGRNSMGEAHLSEFDKAALVYHEIIYAHRRDSQFEKTSLVTRQIVGLLFSTLSEPDLTSKLRTIFNEKNVWTKTQKGYFFQRLGWGETVSFQNKVGFFKDKETNLIWHPLAVADTWEIASQFRCRAPKRLPTRDEFNSGLRHGINELFPYFDSGFLYWTADRVDGETDRHWALDPAGVEYKWWNNNNMARLHCVEDATTTR